MLFPIHIIYYRSLKNTKDIAYSYIFIILSELHNYSVGILIRITMDIYIN